MRHNNLKADPYQKPSFRLWIQPSKQLRLRRLADVVLRVDDAIMATVDRAWDGETVEIRVIGIKRHRQLHRLRNRLVHEILYLLTSKHARDWHV